MRTAWALPLACCLLHLARSFTVIDDDGSICMVANVTATFKVKYEHVDGRMEVATFDLPSSNVSTTASECGGGGRDVDLALSFTASRHTLSLRMNHNATTFVGDAWHFVYNLSDSVLFPGARDSDGKVFMFESYVAAPLNTAYTCWAEKWVTSKHVSIKLSNVRIQPYIKNNIVSKVASHCKDDFPLTTSLATTTPTPTTPTTTPSRDPLTSSPGTVTPNTVPTTSPPVLTVGSYNISVGNRSCLLAQMALEMVLVYSTEDNVTRRGVLHVNPNATRATGTCGDTIASLSLVFSQGAIALGFTANKSTDKFYLTAVNVTLLDAFPDEPWLEMTARNGSLAMFSAPLGRSYSCASEQTVEVTPALELRVSRLRLQPFHVTGGRYAMAVECPQDAKQWIIPIVMGAALACLAVVVLAAYLYGQHKHHSAYTTL